MALRPALTVCTLALALLFAGAASGEEPPGEDLLPELPQADLDQIERAEAEITLHSAVAAYHQALIEQLSGSRDPDDLLLIWHLDWLHDGDAADRAIARALPRARDNLLINFAAMKICQIRPERDFCRGRDYPARLRELEPDNAQLVLWQMPLDPALPGFETTLQALVQASDWADIHPRLLRSLLTTLDRIELNPTSLQACLAMTRAEQRLLEIERPEVIEGPPESPELRCQAPRRGDREMAISMAAASAIPPYTGLVRGCRAEQAREQPRLGLCLAAASKMVEHSQTLIESMMGMGLLDELAPETVSTEQRQRHDARVRFNTELAELMQQLGDRHMSALMERLIALTAEHGEVAAMDTLMSEIEQWQTRRDDADALEQPEPGAEQTELAEDDTGSDQDSVAVPEDLLH